MEEAVEKKCLTVLGSSSGQPQPDRASSGYLIQVGESLNLIDCGSGVTSSFLRRGFNPLDVDRIFISHTHSDHVSDLSLFIQLVYNFNNKKRTTPLDIYLPEEFLEPFERYLQAVYLFKQKLQFDLRLIGYRDGFEFHGPFRLNAIGNNHLSVNRELIETYRLPNRMQSHSFVIDLDTGKIFYSSDIASFDEIKSYLDGCDVVLLEPTHIDLDAFFTWAPEAKVGRFIITHLSGPEEVVRINRMAAKAGMDNLVTAVDGMEISL